MVAGGVGGIVGGNIGGLDIGDGWGALGCAGDAGESGVRTS